MSFFSKNQIGENNPSWKNKKSINSGGYYVYAIKHKRIQVHREIMENFIGRKLKKFETVHHKNGIRTDNRIENLELWAKPQPSGQRVIDLLNFCASNYKTELIELLKQSQ